MSTLKEQLLQQLFSKFIITYPVEAIAIIDIDGEIKYLEKKKEEFIKNIDGLTNYLKPRIESLLQEGSAYMKYGIASLDSSKFRHIFVRVNPETILYVVFENAVPTDKVEPYALFAAEKAYQILFEKFADQSAMPSLEFASSKIFDKFKDQLQQIGFDSGGIYRFKFVIIGDGAVGKTSIVHSFVEKKFGKDYRSTIGFNIITHEFRLLSNTIHAIMWDLGGQEFYHRMRKQYYLGSQAAFIVFDLTNRESFEHALNYWYTELREYVKKKDFPILLVGNKADLVKQRKVKYEEGVKLADELSTKEGVQVAYIETSALNGTGIDEAFGMLSYQYIIKSKEEEKLKIQDEIVKVINSILAKKKKLTLAFFAESLMWSPAVRILTDINKLGPYDLAKDEIHEKIYQYRSGLKLKSFSLGLKDISDCEFIYCVFDALGREHIDERWRDLVLKILQVIDPSKVLTVAIRVSKKQNWNQILREFNVDPISPVSFFQIGDEFQLDIHQQIHNVLSNLDT